MRIGAPAGAEVMLRQVLALGDDIRQFTVPIDDELAGAVGIRERRKVTSIRVIGCGDSFHAGLAAGQAFREVQGLDYAALPAHEYAAYRAPAGPPPETGTELVVAVSASGGTPAAIEAVQAAAGRSATTLAITGRDQTALAEAAGRCAVAAITRPEPSPGIRTYSASLLALLLLARQFAADRGGAHDDGAAGRRRELTMAADAVDATNEALGQRAAGVQEHIADAPAVVVAGSGPSFGTARHAAAKLAEGAGVLALAEELEEWRHVERFAGPASMPLLVVAPPGRSAGRAVQIAQFAAGLGRRVVMVAPEEAAAAASARVLPLSGMVAEDLSPLTCQLFAPHLAFHWACRLGREPFRRGEVGFHPGAPGNG